MANSKVRFTAPPSSSFSVEDSVEERELSFNFPFPAISQRLFFNFYGKSHSSQIPLLHKVVLFSGTARRGLAVHNRVKVLLSEKKNQMDKWHIGCITVKRLQFCSTTYYVNNCFSTRPSKINWFYAKIRTTEVKKRSCVVVRFMHDRHQRISCLFSGKRRRGRDSILMDLSPLCLLLLRGKS